MNPTDLCLRVLFGIACAAPWVLCPSVGRRETYRRFLYMAAVVALTATAIGPAAHFFLRVDGAITASFCG